MGGRGSGPRCNFFFFSSSFFGRGATYRRNRIEDLVEASGLADLSDGIDDEHCEERVARRVTWRWAEGQERGCTRDEKVGPE